jgi:hypothetical protein
MRKTENERRQGVIDAAYRKLDTIEDNTKDLADKKPWITEEQKKEIYDKSEETKKWLKE